MMIGDAAWCIESRSQHRNNRKASVMNWYKYRLMYRGRDDDSQRNDLHRFGKLFQQYIVDMYAKMESSRLGYVRLNQKKMRSDLYSGVMDAMRLGDNDMREVGRRTVLPSSFYGGPRHMQQLYQDAMSIVRRFGKPDLFVTFTCNPSWPEIQEALLEGQSAPDRPDIVVRVFKLKLKELLHDLTKQHVLGKVIAHVHTVEFQKRGLPHAHILLILDQDHKPRNGADCDDIVNAELPDADKYPEARATVSKSMMHGLCGVTHPQSPCMKDGVCTKGFPKTFVNETIVNEDGYPQYRRRQNPNDYVIRNGAMLDNRWVVPHNVYLCTKYDAHTNVEICSSILSIKYVYKYVYKGHDRAAVAVSTTSNNNNAQEDADEIRQYLDSRHVSASEGCWRLFSFSLHKEFPAHQRLAIHLENEQLVTFNEDADPTIVASRAHETTLTAWFQYNRDHPNDTEAHETLYPDFPERFVHLDDSRSWKIRERGHGGTIGRIYNVSPREVEKYHLRLLLYHVPGAKGFRDLRIVNGDEPPTYQAAARLLGLLSGQQEWHECLEQASHYQMPYAMRQLFAIILHFAHPKIRLSYGYSIATYLLKTFAKLLA